MKQLHKTNIITVTINLKIEFEINRKYPFKIIENLSDSYLKITI